MKHSLCRRDNNPASVWIALVILGSGLFCFSGCLGKAGPVEEYLRVGGGESACAGAGQPQEQAGGAVPGAAAKTRALIAVGKVKTSESLDRQAVMLATGRVLTPSSRWYWEASPGRLLEEALTRALNCSSAVAAVRPVHASAEADFLLTGYVVEFEVRRDEKLLTASVDIQVWDREGERMIASRAFATTESLSSIDAPSIADAGARALDGLGAETAGWVEGVTAKEGRK